MMSALAKNEPRSEAGRKRPFAAEYWEYWGGGLCLYLAVRWLSLLFGSLLWAVSS